MTLGGALTFPPVPTRRKTRPNRPRGKPPAYSVLTSSKGIEVAIGPHDKSNVLAANSVLQVWTTFHITPASIGPNGTSQFAQNQVVGGPALPGWTGYQPRQFQWSGELEPPLIYLTSIQKHLTFADGAPVPAAAAKEFSPDRAPAALLQTVGQYSSGALTSRSVDKLTIPTDLGGGAQVVMDQGGHAGGAYIEPHAFSSMMNLLRERGEVVRLIIGDEYGWNVLAHVTQWCVLPDQRITTRTGPKPIRDVRVGDEVLTHRGRWRRVQEVLLRKHDGPIVGISAYGAGNRTAWLTENHPVWAQQPPDCYRYRNISEPAKMRWRRAHPERDVAPTWTQSALLRGGDRVLIPTVPRGENQQPTLIMDREGTVEQDGWLYPARAPDSDPRRKFDWEEARARVSSGEQIAHVAQALGVSAGSVARVTRDMDCSPAYAGAGVVECKTGGRVVWRAYYGGGRERVWLGRHATRQAALNAVAAHRDSLPTLPAYERRTSHARRSAGHGVPVTVPLDRDVARLMGLYLAEGEASNRQVCWTFHTNEEEYQHFVDRVLQERFGLATNRWTPRRKEWRCIVGSAILQRTLANEFGSGSHQKHIPTWLMECADRNVIASVLQGLFEGDSHREVRCWTLTTVSHELARQAADLLQMLGLAPSISWYWRENRETRDGSRVGNYLVRVPTCALADAVMSGGEIAEARTPDRWLTAHEPKLRNYDGVVYDLRVEDDASYVVDGIAVHNSPSYGDTDPDVIYYNVTFEEHLISEPVIAANQGKQAATPKKTPSRVDIVDGMTLRHLAAQYLGSSKKWVTLLNLNRPYIQQMYWHSLKPKGPAGRPPHTIGVNRLAPTDPKVGTITGNNFNPDTPFRSGGSLRLTAPPRPTRPQRKSQKGP